MKKQTNIPEVKPSDLFGISDEQAEEIIAQFRKERHECNTVLGLAQSLKLAKKGDNGFMGYLFGRFVHQNQLNHEAQSVKKTPFVTKIILIMNGIVACYAIITLLAPTNTVPFATAAYAYLAGWLLIDSVWRWKSV